MADSSPLHCLVCGQDSAPVFTATVLGNVKARFAECSDCGFIQAISPDWLEAAYDSAINDTDLGLVSRCVRTARLTRDVVTGLFGTGASVLDFGGGYGITVRRLRDLGIDAWRWDPHCENLFAPSFESTKEKGRRFDLVTAFEVAEHLTHPDETFADLFRRGENVFFSTTLLPDTPPAPGNWDYYGLEHGQHIAFYTLRSLGILAKRHGKHLVSNGHSLHLMTAKPVSSFWFRALVSDRFPGVAGAVHRKLRGVGCPSLLQSDYQAAVQAAKGTPRPKTKPAQVAEPVS